MAKVFVTNLKRGCQMKDFFIGKVLFSCLVLTVSIFPSPPFADDNPVNALSDKYATIHRHSAKEKLYDKGPQAIPLLLQGLRNSDDSIQIECVRMLGELKSKKAVPDLLQYLKEKKNTHAVLVTSYALGRIKDKRATLPLIDMASPITRDDIRRRGAIIALGLLGDSQAIQELENILTDNNETLRVLAAGSLGLLGRNTGFDVALKATRATDFSNRILAIQALGLIGNKMAMPVLNDLLIQKPSMVETQTIELAKFQIELSHLSQDQRVSTIKTKLLLAPETNALTRWGLQALVDIGDSSAKAALNEVIQKHKSSDIRSEAVRQIKVLTIIEKTSNGGAQ